MENPTASEQPQLSKKKLKKLARAEEWAKKAGDMKRQKRDRMKQKKRQQRKIVEEKKRLGLEPTEEDWKGLKRSRRGRGYKKELQAKLLQSPTVIIDCSFDEHHGQKELVSMSRQIEHCISCLRRHEKVIKMAVTGVSEQFEQVLKVRNYDRWPVQFEKDPSLTQLCPLEKLVYLTGDATEDMGEYDVEAVYVLGGIVDHNKLKNITLNKAKDLNIKTQRFPIGQYIQLKTSAILSINHSFELLMRKLNGESWQDAVKNTIPARKIQAGEEEGPDTPSLSSSGSSEESGMVEADDK